MDIDHNCPNCKTEPETIMHAIWFCKRAKDVWNIWSPAKNISPDNTWTSKDLLLQAYTLLNKHDLSIFLTLIWLIWNNRNCMIFGRHVKASAQLPDWALGRTGATDQRWIPPRNDCYIVNVDAGFDEEHGSADVSIGEAVAIRDGVSLALEANFTPFIIRSDAKVVVDYFNSNIKSWNEVALLAADCSLLGNNNQCLGYHFVSRNVNRVAHMLARKALVENCSEHIWVESVPSDISHIVMADISFIFY
ncbi:uncharacterized protein LOC126681935 [Mercurialis annua]|uniref:uncharacterized protein LOC126681935 n=1 Tax=Mercurialis annua TaxID=3986 RepID=UPI00215F4560|nr:uncharacterized protein LOC126681935 [Mercurialis annua]